MGNRAVITFAEEKYFLNNVGIYLHWNGGIDSIMNFLTYAKMKKYFHDESYAMARLTQLIGNFFGGNTSIGIGICRQLDWSNMDNGVYFVGKNFELEKQIFYLRDFENPEKDKKEVVNIDNKNDYIDIDFLLEIDNNQPKEEQLGEKQIKKFLKDMFDNKKQEE